MNLTEFDRERLLKYYSESLKQHGPYSAKAFHWLSVRDQLVRFDALSRVGDISGYSILDVGCGAGDMYDFLFGQFKDFSYLGVDIVPEMTATAREKYPVARFMTADIFSIAEQSDYVFASGALTFNVSGGKPFYFNMVRHMYSLARKAVAFNVLDSRYTTTDECFLVYSWQEIADLCEELGGKYQIITGYEQGDFTVHLHKDIM